jgi:hypothetical protein
MAESKRFTLNKEDLSSLFRGLVITMLGAGLTYLTEAVAKVDFGVYTPLVVPAFALLVNFVRKFVAGK